MANVRLDIIKTLRLEQIAGCALQGRMLYWVDKQYAAYAEQGCIQALLAVAIA